MANARQNIVLTAVALMLLGAAEGAPPTAAGQDCGGVRDYLSPCNPYVAMVSPDEQPSLACCESLRTVDISCMCALIDGPTLPNVDRTRALGLPQACNLPTGGGRATVNIENIADCKSG